MRKQSTYRPKRTSPPMLINRGLINFCSTKKRFLKMGNTIAEFVEKLKERLKNNQGNYNEHHSWCGNTEGGFYDKDEFDFDALMKEIDTFSEEFKSNKEAPNAEVSGRAA